MRSNVTRVLLQVLAVASLVMAIPYTPQDGVAWMNDNAKEWPSEIDGGNYQEHRAWTRRPGGGLTVESADCGHALGRAILEATGGKSLVPADWKDQIQQAIDAEQIDCTDADKFVYEDGTPEMTNDLVENYFCRKLKMAGEIWGRYPYLPNHPLQLLMETWLYQQGRGCGHNIMAVLEACSGGPIHTRQKKSLTMAVEGRLKLSVEYETSITYATERR